MTDEIRALHIIGLVLTVLMLIIGLRLFALEADVRRSKPQHPEGIISHAVNTARQLNYTTDQLADARAALNRVEALYSQAAPFPHVGTAALREALDGHKPPVKIKRHGGRTFTQKEWEDTHKVPSRTRDTERAAAGDPQRSNQRPVQPLVGRKENPMSNPTICPQCHGAGSIETDDGLGPDHRTCPACEGNGDTAGPLIPLTPGECTCIVTATEHGPNGYQISYTANLGCPAHAEAIRNMADQGGRTPNYSIDKDPQP